MTYAKKKKWRNIHFTGGLGVVIDTLRLTFTANVKPLANFLFYNSIIMVFTKVLKYIKQLLNLWYLAII